MDALFSEPNRGRWVTWLAIAVGVVAGGQVAVAAPLMLAVPRYGF